MAVSQTKTRPEDRFVLVPVLIMLTLWAVGVLHWLRTGDMMSLLFFGYIGLFVGVGIGGYIALPDRHRPLARKMVIILLGSLLLLVAIVSDHGNMQIEGLFFAVLAGVGPYIVFHYALAKIIGPLFFGRIWCGWACWFGMVFDLLPYPYSHYRKTGKINWLRYLHFGFSLLLIAVLVFGFGYSDGALGLTGLHWFLIGLLLYYVVGISMALIYKDNRAFCKYLCPISVPLKATTRLAVLRVSGTADKCENCEACVEMCPMNIRIKDYLTQGQRVTSTECIMCLTCINVCPHDSLTISAGLNVKSAEYLDYEPDVRKQRADYKERFGLVKRITQTIRKITQEDMQQVK